MPRTQVNCPNCRQPTVVEVEQLFDLNVDPTAKERFLSGAFNLIQCSVCGYQGSLATPIVYHDPEKELLLTFVPAELGLPRDEQERAIGSLINQVVNKLPQEKRKGYLLNPQTTLTMQGLMEKVLESEGITKEMIQEQQKKLNLIRRLVDATDPEVRAEIAKQEDSSIDAEFFALLGRLIESAMASGDQGSSQLMLDLQNDLLPITTYGKQIQEQTQEVQTAIEQIQSLGKEVTREKLMDLIVNSPNDTQLSVMVSLVRPAIDYQFFQMLSERIDRARGDGRNRLVELRTKLLEMTQAIDQQMAARQQQAKAQVESLLIVDDIESAVKQNLQNIDEYFVAEVERLLEEARQGGDLERSAKLRQILDVIQKASSSPEISLIEEYLDAEDNQARKVFLEAHDEQITSQFMDILANITAQLQSSEDKEFAERAMAANRQALQYSMARNFRAQT